MAEFFGTFPVDKASVGVGIDFARLYCIQYGDGAPAERLGAPIFHTEDLNHNQVYGFVRAVNPFL